jgi:peptide/nickel transport system ATP-binding protein
VSALTVEHLTRELGGTRVLDDVSLDVAPAEIVAVVGASGAGKSTFVRVLAGTLAASAGTIAVAGQRLSTPRTRDDARRIQLVTQHPRSALNRRHPVRHALRQPLRAHRLTPSTAARDAAVDAMAEEVGLTTSLLDHRPDRLSGGELARVVLARALLLSPPVLLLDEPTASLDASVQATVANLLLDLRDRLGTAIVLVTHDHAVAAHVADRVVGMGDGRLDDQVRLP